MPPAPTSSTPKEFPKDVLKAAIADGKATAKLDSAALVALYAHFIEPFEHYGTLNEGDIRGEELG